MAEGEHTRVDGCREICVLYWKQIENPIRSHWNSMSIHKIILKQVDISNI